MLIGIRMMSDVSKHFCRCYKMSVRYHLLISVPALIKNSAVAFRQRWNISLRAGAPHAILYRHQNDITRRFLIGGPCVRVSRTTVAFCHELLIFFNGHCDNAYFESASVLTTQEVGIKKK